MIYLMFLIGSVPVFLAFLLIAYFISRFAKKSGKSPWLWGAVSFLLLSAISWKQLPSLAAFIYYKGMVAAQAAKPNDVTSLAEAKTINIHSSLDGVDFDVPLTYHFRGFNQKSKGWPGVSKGQIDGTERPAVDFIHIYALLPDLAPMNEENLAEFEVLGNGKVVRASLTHYRPWGYDFNLLQSKPGTSETQEMLHYYKQNSKEDLYLSHNHVTPDLTAIECHDLDFWHDVSPACKVVTFYRPAPELVGDKHIEGAIFRLEYSLPSQYLSQWRDIDKRLKTLFDQFFRNAARRSANN